MGSSDDVREIVAAVKHGLSYYDAVRMHPSERQAFLYVAAEMDGMRVNWETGEISELQQPGRDPRVAGRE